MKDDYEEKKIVEIGNNYIEPSSSLTKVMNLKFHIGDNESNSSDSKNQKNLEDTVPKEIFSDKHNNEPHNINFKTFGGFSIHLNPSVDNDYDQMSKIPESRISFDEVLGGNIKNKNKIAQPIDLQGISSPDYSQFRSENENEELPINLNTNLTKSGLSMKGKKKNLNIADPQKIYKMHINETINSIKAVQNISPELKEAYKSKMINPIQTKFKLSFVFDIDETLVHLPKKENETPGNILLEFTMPNGQKAFAGIHIRPYARVCLKEISKFANVFLFTAGLKSYAEVIYQYFDPGKEYITKVLSREDCIFDKSLKIYIKDLRILGLDLNFTFLVDNSVISFALNIDNGIPALPFFDDDNDEYLLRLIDYAKKLNNSLDPLKCNIEEFKLREVSSSFICDYLHLYMSSPYHTETVIHREFDFSKALKYSQTPNPEENMKKLTEIPPSNKISQLLKPIEAKMSTKTKKEIDEILLFWKSNRNIDASQFKTPKIQPTKTK